MQKSFRRPLRWGGFADIAAFLLAAAFVAVLAVSADKERALAGEMEYGVMLHSFVYVIYVLGALAFTAVLGVISLFVGMNALHGVGAWQESARIAAHIKNSMAQPVIFLIAAVPALFFLQAFPAALTLSVRISLVCIGCALVFCLLASAAGKVVSASRMQHAVSQPKNLQQ